MSKAPKCHFAKTPLPKWLVHVKIQISEDYIYLTEYFYGFLIGLFLSGVVRVKAWSDHTKYFLPVQRVPRFPNS